MDLCAPDISIVIPVRNEAENIAALGAEIAVAMDTRGLAWECIWVDDGSTDAGLAVLGGLAQADPRHRYLSFESNAGQSAAYWAGFNEAEADLIATLDGDGQNDPADLPRLVQLVRSGAADMACGYRARRKDSPVRKLASLVAKGFRTLVTGDTPIRDVGCSTRVFRKECVMSLPTFSGMHRFLPTLFALRGYKLAEAPVNHRPRTRGKTKYSVNNRLWVGLFDTFGVFWLQKRALRYTIRASSGCGEQRPSK